MNGGGGRRAHHAGPDNVLPRGRVGGQGAAEGPAAAPEGRRRPQAALTLPRLRGGQLVRRRRRRGD